jgi:hypothetical protein
MERIQSQISPEADSTVPVWVTFTPEHISSPEECIYSLTMFDEQGGSQGEHAQDIDLNRSEFIQLKAWLAALRRLTTSAATAGNFSMASARDALRPLLRETVIEEAQDFGERAAVEDLVLMHAILRAWYCGAPGHKEVTKPILLSALSDVLEPAKEVV